MEQVTCQFEILLPSRRQRRAGSKLPRDARSRGIRVRL
jgi:hypothetical protein